MRYLKITQRKALFMTAIEKIKAEIIEVIQNIHDKEVLIKIKEYIDEIINYSEEEWELIGKIQEGLSPEISDRIHTLLQAQRDRKLTDNEDKELTELIDMTEAATGTRLENMIKLSKLWNVSVDEIRKKLNLKTPEPRVLW